MTQQLVGTGLNVSQHEGVVRGRVRYVGTPADVIKLMRDPEITSTVVLTQGGAVTFAGALLPKRPAGLVTIEGAPESHLGIVSREFNIPAVMSVQLTEANGVQRVDANGLTTKAYVEHVVAALNDKVVEINCENPDAGHVYLV